MTREELKEHCERQIEMCELWANSKGEKPSGKVYEEHKLILELLEQEPCYNTDEWCHDCSEYDQEKHCCHRWSKVIRNAVEEMKQPKTGQWKVVSDGYGDSAYICECSECKDTVWVYKDADRKWNYCPNCGCRMVEPQGSEES